MNKSFFIALAALLLGGVGGVQAQQSKQKIGNNPYKINHPDAVLEVESATKGVLLPRVPLTNTTSAAPLSAHVAGMMVYNTATAGDVTPGVYTNNGTVWVKNEPSAVEVPTLEADCNVNGFSSVNVVKGVAVSGLNFTVTLTNNTWSMVGPIGFAASDLVLSGANAGLTVSAVNPATNTITPGLSQVVTYTITGTPTTDGVLTGKWKKLVLTCENTKTVQPTLVTTLNCAGATFNTAFTDNTASYWTKIVLPYTGGNGGPYTTQTFSSTGVTGMTATLAAGNLAVGAGNLTFTVSGTPSASGNADFSISIGGQTCTVSMAVMGFSTTGNGSTAALTSRSCNAIKLANASATDGVYFIDIDGVDGTYTAQQAYCDMTADAGGWTLVSQWGTATTTSTVSTLTDPTSTGQLSSGFIRQLAGFSTGVRIQKGSSPTNLTASGVGMNSALTTQIKNGGSLGNVGSYTWSGSLGVVNAIASDPGQVPTCGLSMLYTGDGSGHPAFDGLESSSDVYISGPFMALDRFTSTRTHMSRWYACISNCSGIQQWCDARRTNSLTTLYFEVADVSRPAFRAVWLK
jgi:hypothetical protein